MRIRENPQEGVGRKMKRRTLILAVFLSSCLIKILERLNEKKDGTAISYGNSHCFIVRSIYHHCHSSFVSSLFSFYPVSLSLIHLVHCVSYRISFSSITSPHRLLTPHQLHPISISSRYEPNLTLRIGENELNKTARLILTSPPDPPSQSEIREQEPRPP